MSLTLPDLQSRTRQEITLTMECSGNTGLPFFTGGIGNATWAGTSLSALLEEAAVLDEGFEVVFWGADAGTPSQANRLTSRSDWPKMVSGPYQIRPETGRRQWSHVKNPRFHRPRRYQATPCPCR